MENIALNYEYIDNSYKEEQYKLDSIKAYYNSIRIYPVLSKDEEQALFIKWKQHKDITAKERLFCCNLRYVYKVAYNICLNQTFTSYTVEDLIQEGNIGLLKALEKFDYTTGYRLLSYADQYIKGYIYKEIYSKDRLIRIPSNIEANYNKIKKAKAFLEKYSKDKITLEKLAKTSSLELKDVKRTLEYVKTIIYFDNPLNNHSSKQEGSNKTIQDTLVDKNTDDLMRIILEENMRSERYDFLNKLNTEEKNIILQKYSYLEKVVTDEELALLNNTTVDKVQKNINRAKRKLRQNQKRF